MCVVGGGVGVAKMRNILVMVSKGEFRVINTKIHH